MSKSGLSQSKLGFLVFGGEFGELTCLYVEVSLGILNPSPKSSDLAVYSVKRQKLVSKTHRDLQLIVRQSSTLPDGFAPHSK